MLATSLASGWWSVGLVYGTVQLPMIVGLAKHRGRLHQYLTSPAVAVPLTAAVGLGIALANPLLSAMGASSGGLIQSALGVSFGMAAGYAGGRLMAQDVLKNKIHQRGALVAERPPDGENRAPRVDAHNITVAGRAIPPLDETKHFKLIGTTGTGKSTAIREILDSALARGDRAVVADPDGGYLQRFYNPDRGDVVLNPFDERSVKWDLFSEIRSSFDVEQLARSLIPDQEGSDRSWRGYARTFFTAVTRQAHEAGVTDVAELYRLLMVADTKELRTLVHATPAQPFLEEHNAKMFDSIRSVTSSAVGALEYIAQQKGMPFSVRSWVSDGQPGVLFIPYKAGQIAALRSSISGWMRLAIFEAMDRPEQPPDQRAQGNQGLWFVVDELDALGQIDGLKDALARLRKFGGRCVLGFQSIAQVSSTYGHGDAHTIVENCGNTLILRCSASEGGGTARFASQLIGEREVMLTTVSRSRRASEMLGSVSHSEHFSVESAVMASQIEQLPDLSGYLKYASDPRWQRVQLEARQTWQESRAAAQSSTARGGAPARSAGGREAEGRERD